LDKQTFFYICKILFGVSQIAPKSKIFPLFLTDDKKPGLNIYPLHPIDLFGTNQIIIPISADYKKH